MGLPIDPDILYKRKDIPKKIAQLSYINPEKALHYVRVWGERKMPVTPLYDELNKQLQTTAKTSS